MKKLLLLPLALAAFVLCAGESVPNLHVTKELQIKGKNIKGKTNIVKHWYAGTIAGSGKFNGSGAILLLPEPAKQYFNGVIAGYSHKLPPGRYVFSVWCKVDENIKDILYLRLIHRFTQNGKRHNLLKKYYGTAMPKVGEWTELSETFEVGKDHSNGSFLFGHFASKPVKVWYAKPSVERSPLDE